MRISTGLAAATIFIVSASDTQAQTTRVQADAMLKAALAQGLASNDAAAEAAPKINQCTKIYWEIQGRIAADAATITVNAATVTVNEDDDEDESQETVDEAFVRVYWVAFNAFCAGQVAQNFGLNYLNTGFQAFSMAVSSDGVAPSQVTSSFYSYARTFFQMSLGSYAQATLNFATAYNESVKALAMFE